MVFLTAGASRSYMLIYIEHTHRNLPEPCDTVWSVRVQRPTWPCTGTCACPAPGRSAATFWKLQQPFGTKKTENYQAKLSWHIARALMHDEELSEQAYAVQQDHEAQELTGILRKLGTQHSHEAIRLAYKLHRNLGHPRKEALVKMLQAKKCSPKVIAAVEAMKCPYCNKFAVKKQSALAHAERPTEFNNYRLTPCGVTSAPSMALQMPHQPLPKAERLQSW